MGFAMQTRFQSRDRTVAVTLIHPYHCSTDRTPLANTLRIPEELRILSQKSPPLSTSKQRKNPIELRSPDVKL